MQYKSSISSADLNQAARANDTHAIIQNDAILWTGNNDAGKVVWNDYMGNDNAGLFIYAGKTILEKDGAPVWACITHTVK